MKRGFHLQYTQHKNSHQANLSALIHLQPEENVERKYNGDEIGQNCQTSGRYAERELLYAVPLNQWVPVYLNGNALEKDDEEHGYHQSSVEDDSGPDDLSNEGLDAGEAQQEDQYRLLHQCKDRVIYGSHDIYPYQAHCWIERFRNIPKMDSDIHFLHDYTTLATTR